MVLQQTNAIGREESRQVFVENTVEDEWEDEAEEAFGRLGVVIEAGLEFNERFSFIRPLLAKKREGLGEVVVGGGEAFVQHDDVLFFFRGRGRWVGGWVGWVGWRRSRRFE